MVVSGIAVQTPKDNCAAEDTTTKSVDLEGYQINTKIGTQRIIASVEPVINGKSVVDYGLIYGLESFNKFTTSWKEEDMVAGSENRYVYMQSTEGTGVLTYQFGKSETATYFQMSMTFGEFSKVAYEANYKVRAYAKLSDGTYVYGSIYSYSIFKVASYLYQKQRMKTEEEHDYLYNNILTVVDPSYGKIDFGWSEIVTL